MAKLSGPHRGVLGALFAAALLTGCGASSLPASRGLITLSGARLPADPDRMDAIDLWIRPQLDNIRRDPTFFINPPRYQDGPVMPWEDLVIEGDTATFGIDGAIVDAQAVYLVYAHLHLMRRMERLDEWLPDAAELDGYELERVIVARAADVWFYGRSVFGWPPYSALDELLYSNENGYLDAYLLTARAEEFAAERDAWLDESAGALEEYRAWFRGAFETNPPGLR